MAFSAAVHVKHDSADVTKDVTKARPNDGTVHRNPSARPQTQHPQAQDTKQSAAAAPQPESLEFGGSAGTLAIIVFSHFLQFYFWLCLDINRGNLVLPSDGESWLAFAGRCLHHIGTHAAPTVPAALWYMGFLTVSALCSAYMPGIQIPGLPLADGKILQYNCNGLLSWYFVLALSVPTVVFRVGGLPSIVDMLGPLLSVSAIAGNLAAVATWAAAYAKGVPNRATGRTIYDLFMGVYLNPRLLKGRLDLKMWSETRVSWYLLFLITLSCASEQFRETGRVTGPMVVMIVAHALYANACAKGEECIPTTWDIFHENWGWMLSFWNLCGVPFMYSWQSVYILRNDYQHSPAATAAILALLLAAYYVWDTANSQKNRFRMQRQGIPVARPNAFPQLPWGTLANPKTLQTKRGSELLVDGWWQFVRKPHYTADILMAFCWGAACGFSSLLPWVYFTFFCCVLVHRACRDMERCKAKYGTDWDRYCSTVPYVFVPGVL